MILVRLQAAVICAVHSMSFVLVSSISAMFIAQLRPVRWLARSVKAEVLFAEALLVAILFWFSTLFFCFSKLVTWNLQTSTLAVCMIHRVQLVGGDGGGGGGGGGGSAGVGPVGDGVGAGVGGQQGVQSFSPHSPRSLPCASDNVC